MNHITFTNETKVLGRVGVKASQSGRKIYNPYFNQIGLDAIYLQFEIGEDKSREFIESIKTLNILGCGVTGVHTHNFMELVDHVDESAKVTNHGNCLVNREGVTTLYSTDVVGMFNTLVPLEGTLDDKSIVILGGGALMPGILNELKKYSVKEIVLYNRTVEKLTPLSSTFGCTVGGNLDELIKSGKGDIFINATHIGSASCETSDEIFTNDFLKRFKTVMDVTFLPGESIWAKRAKDLGLKVGFGYEMFVHQGAQQLRLILNQEPNIDILKPLVMEGLK